MFWRYGYCFDFSLRDLFESHFYMMMGVEDSIPPISSQSEIFLYYAKYLNLGLPKRTK